MLTEYGYVDAAYKLLTQTTEPSWGYMIKMGATTIWERWEYATSWGMNSHNHPMYASVSAWFYKYLAGILPVEGSGFSQLVIKPYLPSELNRAGASVQTVLGEVCSSWGAPKRRVQLEIEHSCGQQGAGAYSAFRQNHY